jgi:hypothetical protein
VGASKILALAPIVAAAEDVQGIGLVVAGSDEPVLERHIHGHEQAVVVRAAAPLVEILSLDRIEPGDMGQGSPSGGIEGGFPEPMGDGQKDSLC